MMTQLERLTTRILHPYDPTPSSEDIFSSALETLFTDDTQQSHGVPGRSIIYCSPRFGDVYLYIPSHPNEEGGRLLFAHYLWNAGVIAAAAIERASCDEDDDEDEDDRDETICSYDQVGSQAGGVEHSNKPVKWDKRLWDMRGMNILELGAATALPSLISTLSNASSVISTDHPSSPAITADTITSNFKVNITNRGKPSGLVPRHPQPSGATEREYIDNALPTLHHPPISTNTTVTVAGYTWGTELFYRPQAFGKPLPKQPKLKAIDKIIIADCLWMPQQHVNLVKTILSYLKPSEDDDTTTASVSCALVIAGFHTGREVVSRFIEIATGTPTGAGEVTLPTERDVNGDNGDVMGLLRAIEIFEVDVYGQQRPWAPERPEETKEQLKRWCMCAALVRR